MKLILQSANILLSIAVLLESSCKKEHSCVGCKDSSTHISTNKPPIASAGPDQVITLPTDSVTLDGTNSSDPDGRISEWLWTKISGPASFNIGNSIAPFTKVKELVEGAYVVELEVRDDKGLFAKDTVNITVNSPSTVSIVTDSVFEHVKQSNSFYEIDWLIRDAMVPCPGLASVRNVYVKWSQSMDWYEIPICGMTCTPNQGLATFYDNILHVYLDAYLTNGNSQGNYLDFIDIKLVF